MLLPLVVPVSGPENLGRTSREQISDSAPRAAFCQNTGAQVPPGSRHTAGAQSQASQVPPELPALASGLTERPHRPEVPLERPSRVSVPGTGQEPPGWTEAMEVANAAWEPPKRGQIGGQSPRSGHLPHWAVLVLHRFSQRNWMVLHGVSMAPRSLQRQQDTARGTWLNTRGYCCKTCHPDP